MTVKYQKHLHLCGDELTTSRVFSIRHFAASTTILGAGTLIARVWFNGFTGTWEAGITLSTVKSGTIDI